MEVRGDLLAIVAAILCFVAEQTSSAPTANQQQYSYRQWAAMQAARYYSWDKPELPDISMSSVVAEKVPRFHGDFMDILPSKCDRDCQMAKTSKPANLDELKTELQYDTLDLMRKTQFTSKLDFDFVPSNILGEEVETNDVIDDNVMRIIEDDDLTEEYSDIPADESDDVRSRQKRKVYGLDTRFTIPSKKFLSVNPFTSAVRISTGCSGVMISPRHVLTSAHCLHDGQKFIQGTRRIKVGKLTDEPKKRRGGKKKKGKGRKGKGKKNRKSKKKSKRERRDVAATKDVIATEDFVATKDFASTKDAATKDAATKDAAAKEAATKNAAAKDAATKNSTTVVVEPYFKWTRAKRIHIPTEWANSANASNEDYPIEFDFAVIEMKKDITKQYMDIGISPEKKKIPGRNHNVHFTGFDNDRPDTFVYRFCPVEEESPDIIYHYCDANQGTSGSGVYIKLFDLDRGRYYNRVVALFSGNQQVRLPDGSSKNYNTAVRITPLKYTLICHWTDGHNPNCKK